MKKETLEATLKSIAKWKRIVGDVRAKDRGPKNCALCKRFGDTECTGCPVDKASADEGCANTPYQEWEDHHEFEDDHETGERHRVPGCKTCLRLAKAELAFLESLLPKGQNHD